MKVSDRSLFVMALIALVVMIASHFYLDRAMRESHLREVAIARDAGEIGRLDEVLTMSARIAAVTGRDDYRQRYERNAALLDRIIKTDMRRSLDEAMEAHFIAIDEANLALVEIEMESFAADDPGAAIAMLESPDYMRLKEIYSENTAAVLEEVAERQKAYTGILNLALTGLIVSMSLVAVAVFMLMQRIHRVRTEMAEREASFDTLRTVMSSVRDAFNDFLNRMIFFRLRAESPDPLSQEDAKAWDASIEDARSALQTIAERADRRLRGVADPST